MPQFSESADESLLPIDRKRGPWLQLINPAGFEWNLYHLPIRQLPAAFEGLRIVQISDAHLRPGFILSPRWFKAYDRLIDRLKNNPPDLILLTGDMIEHKMDHQKSLPILERFLTALSAKLGTFAILANHDGDVLGAHLQRLGVNLINRRFVRLSANNNDNDNANDTDRDNDGDAHLDLIGVPSVLRNEVRDGILTKIPPRKPNSLRIVLAHYPDTIRELVASGIEPDIVFAGHTHGGQVCLPNGAAIIQHDSLRRPYYAGVHHFGQTWLVISRGLGFATYPIRLFCPAEIIELKLTRE